MYVLGIAGLGLEERSTLGHDPAAALLKDGEIIAAAEEERFTRVKHAPGYFPYNAVKFCLSRAGIGIEEVDRIAGYWKPELVFKNAFLHEGYYAHPLTSTKFFLLWKMYEMKYRNNVKHIAYTLEKNGAVADSLLKKFTTVEHHLCHAASAYYCSGFKDATIVTMDGMGENISTLVGENDGTALKKHVETYSPHSLGTFYSLFTEYLGFEPNEAEYKVMGLAPYGRPGVKMDDLLWTKDGKVHMDKRMLGKFKLYSDYIVQRFGPLRLEHDALEQRHKDIAYALQDRLQKVSLELVKWAL
ncbi:MAG: carbamoyltransferase N-terminal domain-containing protein, partial [Candidatus Micrarchaeia archaeon]